MNTYTFLFSRTGTTSLLKRLRNSVKNDRKSTYKKKHPPFEANGKVLVCLSLINRFQCFQHINLSQLVVDIPTKEG